MTLNAFPCFIYHLPNDKKSIYRKQTHFCNLEEGILFASNNFNVTMLYQVYLKVTGIVLRSPNQLYF